MDYRSPGALEMALKEAARKAPMDTNRAIAGFYHHRLLCRVFSDPSTRFVLKGGQGVLARTVNARATRDVDLVLGDSTINDALEELKRLAAIDLGDFVSFEFVGSEPIKEEDEYREGLSVTFDALLGTKVAQKVSVDLVTDGLPCSDFEMLPPADRVEVKGIPVFDYRVFPAPKALADKLCAMLERHEGRPSSRVKDLVDVVVYERTVDIDGGTLCREVEREARMRKLCLPKTFTLPAPWFALYEGHYAKLAKQAKVDGLCPTLAIAESKAKELFDPVLDRSASTKRWCHGELIWRG